MNFLKTKTSWSNFEIGLIKICMASLYICVGTYFHEFFKDYLFIFGAIFIVTIIWTGKLWFKKMKQ